MDQEGSRLLKVNVPLAKYQDVGSLDMGHILSSTPWSSQKGREENGQLTMSSKDCVIISSFNMLLGLR